LQVTSYRVDNDVTLQLIIKVDNIHFRVTSNSYNNTYTVMSSTFN